MKNRTTTILVGIGIIATTTLLLLLNRKEKEPEVKPEADETPQEDKNSKDTNGEKLTEKNKKIVNEVLTKLIETEEFTNSADLLVNLIQRVVEKTKDVDILYDTPKNIEELIEALRMIDLYDRFEEILRENEK